MRRGPLPLLLLLFFVPVHLLSPALVNAGPYYVDADKGSDNADGLTWGTAKQTITSAISEANTYGGPLCIAAGTYNTEGETFPIRPAAGVSLIGVQAVDKSPCIDTTGFGSGASIISGSNGSGLVSYQGNGTGSNTLLDGFTITNTGGRGVYVEASGDGMIVSPAIRNNIITGNRSYGIDISAYAGTASPWIDNNTITNNAGTGVRGGALYSSQIYSIASPIFTNNLISKNAGDGFYTSEAGDGCLCVVAPTFSNNTITGNRDHGINFYDIGGTSFADLGKVSTPTGRNTIKDNANTNLDGFGYDDNSYYDLYNDHGANQSLFAEDNWWAETPPTSTHINDAGNSTTDADPSPSFLVSAGHEYN